MNDDLTSLARRRFIALASAAAAGVAAGGAAAGADAGARAGAGVADQRSGARGEFRYPKGFLWGAATAGHQVEGGNVNSDIWLLEHVKPTIFAESSGDACNHYQLYREDIALLAGLGFNTYRFSLEWSRIEPAPGEFLTAELEHYRRVLAACHEHGIAPMLTFNHFTTPRWFAAQGGWENPQAPELFARFCGRAAHHLGDLIVAASTLNEPNIGLLLKWFNLPPAMWQVQTAMLQAAAAACGSTRFSAIMAGDPQAMLPNLLKGHRLAYAAIKSEAGRFPWGVSIAMIDDQAVGPDSQRNAKRAECYEPWLAAAAESDFIGVQTYGRSRIGKDGIVPPDAGAELTQMGEEFYPQALEQTIRYAASATKKPVYVTENGIATTDDSRRVAYIGQALTGLERCLADGVDVRGYVHWSLLDNFEWPSGYRPKFGLIGVDRATQVRAVKPSARFLGAIARANAHNPESRS